MSCNLNKVSKTSPVKVWWRCGVPCKMVMTGLQRDPRLVVTGLRSDPRVVTGLLRDPRPVTGLQRDPRVVMTGLQRDPRLCQVYRRIRVLRQIYRGIPVS